MFLPVYSWSDKFIVPPEKPFLESMTALAFLAGATDSIRLGVSVLVAQRGSVADEQLLVARNLFSENHCTFAGEHYSYEDIAFYPKGSVPIWCGGESRAAQRRAGRYGDAWFPYFARVTPEELASRFAYVRENAGDRDVALHCCLSVEVTVEHLALQFLVGRYPERLAQMEGLMPALTG